MDELKKTKKGDYYIKGRLGTSWYGQKRPSRTRLDEDEDGISPIVAVILMVIITVILAATVFLLVSDLTK